MKIPKRITVRMLKRWGACGDGLDLFRRLFGESAEFVPGNVYVAAYEMNRKSSMFGTLLRYIDLETHEAVKKAHLNKCGEDCVYMWECAAVLCRLARQNLPKTKARTKP